MRRHPLRTDVLINGPIPLLDVWAHRLRVRQRDIAELDMADYECLCN